ncbi:MAG: hypothetical protein JXA82_12680 [Sedimentisphaerales bacterium]|nr:hypothetical protein [Sedimentisphaerales bacterium]
MHLHGKSRTYTVGLLVYGVVSFALLAGGYFLTMHPQKQKLDALKMQLSETNERLSEIRQARSPQTMQRLQDRLEGIRDRLSDFVVSLDSAATLNFQIGQLANELELQNLTSERKEGLSQNVLDGCKHLGEVWLELDFETNFPQFADFINLLERNRPIVFVEKFKIEHKAQNPKIKDVQLTLCFFIESKEVAIK